MPRSRPRPDGPDSHDHAATSLPASVPLLAGLGLAILCVCTLPAVHAQRTLERDHARVVRETREAEERVARLKRELGAESQQRYLRIKAARTLLQRGANYIQERDRRLERRTP